MSSFPDRLVRVAVLAGVITVAGCAPAETFCTTAEAAKKSKPFPTPLFPSRGPDGSFQLGIFSSENTGHGSFIRSIKGAWSAGRATQLEAFSINPNLVTVIGRDFGPGGLNLTIDMVAASSVKVNEGLRKVTTEPQKKELLDKVRRCPTVIDQFKANVPNQVPAQDHSVVAFWSDWTYKRVMWDLEDLIPPAP